MGDAFLQEEAGEDAEIPFVSNSKAKKASNERPFNDKEHNAKAKKKAQAQAKKKRKDAFLQEEAGEGAEIPFVSNSKAKSAFNEHPFNDKERNAKAKKKAQ